MILVVAAMEIGWKEDGVEVERAARRVVALKPRWTARAGMTAGNITALAVNSEPWMAIVGGQAGRGRK